MRRIFFELQQTWNEVPFVVVNDGEVTALAASMALEDTAVLGISMGTSQAAGYVNPQGNITDWLWHPYRGWSTPVMRRIVGVVACLLAAAGSHAQTGSGGEPVRYMGGMFIDPSVHDGRLRPAIGVETREVMRANRTHPDQADGFGWTYNHAPMLAYWGGRFYLEYLSNPVGEHIAPGQTLVTTSADGRSWTTPQVVFPPYKLREGGEGMMHQRMGFYVAPNQRLLVLAFYGHAPDPFGKGGIGRVVREAYRDGTYRPIYFIRYNSWVGWNESNTNYPLYTKSNDRGFVEACGALLKDKLKTM